MTRNDKSATIPPVSPDGIATTMRQILDAEARAIASIPVTDDYARAVELIVEHVHRRGGKLVTSGMGKCGQIAMNIATTFCSTGTPAVNLHPAEAQHGDLGILQPDDVMLLLSNSGKTREIVELVDLARNLYAGLPVIVITGKADSPLASTASVTLFTGGSPEVCPPGAHPHHLHHDDDGDRRCARGELHERHSVYGRRLRPAPPRRLSRLCRTPQDRLRNSLRES